eukprot:2527600-Pyramimonas_sp.AAC.1
MSATVPGSTTGYPRSLKCRLLSPRRTGLACSNTATLNWCAMVSMLQETTPVILTFSQLETHCEAMERPSALQTPQMFAKSAAMANQATLGARLVDKCGRTFLAETRATPICLQHSVSTLEASRSTDAKTVTDDFKGVMIRLALAASMPRVDAAPLAGPLWPSAGAAASGPIGS